ncbi:MAG: FAD-dependent oxidoreductase, partial [Gemmatimonadaceae bacterium]
MSLPDVIVVGGGLVGMSCAAALSGRGVAVTLLCERLAGEASPAAAGLLAPSVEPAAEGAHAFAIAARDRYPSYVKMLADSTGTRVPLLRDGILEIALDDAGARSLLERSPHGTWLSRAELSAEEPALAHAVGAMRYELDGAVDNVALVNALRVYVELDPAIAVVPALVMHVHVADKLTVVTTADGVRHEANRIVLAAGAWADRIEGLPRRLPVEPLRGQMIALDGTPVRHPVYGPHGYAVPRPGRETVIGATMERVGFDARTTAEGLSAMASTAREISPAFHKLGVTRAWAGLRPVTPDLLPIIGPDPTAPGLLYACGHSRNGILMAP